MLGSVKNYIKRKLKEKRQIEKAIACSDVQSYKFVNILSIFFRIDGLMTF